jgi:hypothetical protein
MENGMSKAFARNFYDSQVWKMRRAFYRELMKGLCEVCGGVIIGFLLNELVSIIENAGLMGIPLPKAVTNVIELLKKKEEGKPNVDA